MSFFNLLFSKKTDIPEFWESYLSILNEKISGSSFLDEIPFVVFDTETTGFNVQSDKLISIGATKVIKGEIWVEDSFEKNIHYKEPSKSIEVHGILPQRDSKGPEEMEVIIQFVNYIGNSVLVGHHITFDLAFINKVLYDTYKLKLKNQFFDTAHLALKLEHFRPHPGTYNPDSYTLDALCERYRIVPSDRHTAAGDAFITAQLLQKLLAKAKKSGLNTYKRLLK